MAARTSNREVRANFAELAQQWRDWRDRIKILEILRTIKLTHCRSQLIRRTPLQWVIVALVQALNVVAIEALVTDLHPGTERAHGWKSLDSEPDRLCCGRKTAVAQRLSCPALALGHDQVGRYAVIECHSLAVGWFCVHVECYHGNRPERIVWTPSERTPISGGRPCRPGPRSRHRAERDSARRVRSRSQGLRIG